MNAPVSSSSTSILWAFQDKCADGAVAAWVLRIQQGDELAARSLIRRLFPTVIQWVRLCSCDPAIEEAITCGVMARLLRRPARFSRYASLEQWASQNVVGYCIQNPEARKPLLPLCASMLSQDERAALQRLAEEGPVNEVHDKPARDLLKKTLASLPFDQRLVLDLIHGSAWSLKEISHWTGWATWRIRWKAYVGRRGLRRQWKALMKDARRGNDGFLKLVGHSPGCVPGP